MNEPLISVIIVVLNAKNTIKFTIDSILQQEYKNIEIVIVDAESNDGTIDIIKSYSTKINTFISEKDDGVYDAMNKGIDVCTGEWILFLGADDVLYNNQIFSEIFMDDKNHNVDFLYGDVVLTSNKKIYGGERTYMTLIEKNICHQSIFYKKTIFNRLGKYNLRYKVLADFDFNIRVFKDATLRKLYIKKVVSLYNNRGLSSYTIDYTFHAYLLNTFLKNKENSYFIPELQQHHFYFGIVNLYRKHFFLALKHISITWVRGSRKLFYFLFTGKFLVRILSFQKIKIK